MLTSWIGVGNIQSRSDLVVCGSGGGHGLNRGEDCACSGLVEKDLQVVYESCLQRSGLRVVVEVVCLGVHREKSGKTSRENLLGVSRVSPGSGWG